MLSEKDTELISEEGRITLSMKKKTDLENILLPKLCALLFLLLLTAGISGFSRAEDAGKSPGRKLTLMIYMCGSNLESGFGAASADILEMTASGIRGEDVSLLVMTGGSNGSGYSNFFGAGASGIYEISGGRIRRVWQENTSVNMGDPVSLRYLLEFGKIRRPAENYALILWDHGGGPLEGVCWDETHGMDRLSLREVTQALEAAALPGKLSWIGFDACLMSSLEVAGQLAPYAEYMVASQETEPASGWNYAFLKDLPRDRNGAETGRRIVDAYFENQENSGEILTLSCIDLAAAAETIEAMDPVFASLEKNMTEENFPALSGMRMSSTGFGKAAPDQNETGFDLVDVRDFVSHLEPTEETGKLLSCLDRMVVWNRTNEENAFGLTMYHPYANKKGYLEKWKAGYEEISFSPGYQAYVRSFGRILTGERLFLWRNLIPKEVTRDGEGTYIFEMPLSAEQEKNAVSAQVLILRDLRGNEMSDCTLVATCHAEMTDNHSLRAAWDGRALYVELEDHSTEGPIGFSQTSDGSRNVVSGSYYRTSLITSGQTPVQFELDPADRSEYPGILRINAWDEATETMSSRQKVSEADYQMLLMTNDNRIFPGADDQGALPPFQEWTRNDDTFSSYVLYLPNSWRFRMMSADFTQQLYAVFLLTDAQQNSICSLPVPLPNRNLAVLLPQGDGAVDGDGFHAECFCRANSSPEQPMLQLEWTLRNEGAEELRVQMVYPVLNGSRILDVFLSDTLQPGETARETVNVDGLQLWELDSLESLEGEFSLKREGRETEELAFRIPFPSSDLTALRPEPVPPLAEEETEDLTLKLLSMQEDNQIGWELRILAENKGAEKIYLGDVLFNGIHAGGSLDTLPPGRSRIFTVREFNFLSGLFDLNGEEIRFVVLEDNLLQGAGHRQLEEIRVVRSNFERYSDDMLAALRQIVDAGHDEYRDMLANMEALVRELMDTKRTLRGIREGITGDVLLDASNDQFLQSYIGGFGNGYAYEITPFIDRMTLKEPVPLGEKRKIQRSVTAVDVKQAPDALPAVREEDLPLLMDQDGISVRLRRMVSGSKRTVLSLEWINGTDQWSRIKCGPCLIGGLPSGGEASVSLPPRSRRISSLLLEGSLGDAAGEITLSFTRSDTGEEAPPFTARLVPAADPVQDADGVRWLNGQDFRLTADPE